MDELYYSKYCPHCHRANDPPAEHCASCGEGTSWPSIEIFRNYLLRTKKSATIAFLKGAAESFMGFFFMATLLVVFKEAVEQGFGALCVMMLFVTVALSIHGFMRMRRARKGMLFE